MFGRGRGAVAVRRLGAVAFLFFLGKGLLWLALGALAARGLIG